MNKGGGGGVGIGSASIILVFAVLCLSVFSLITFVVAGNDKALIDAEAQLVTGYYDADRRAEQALAEILETGDVSDDSLGIDDIRFTWDPVLSADVVQFNCRITDKKSLYVKVAIDFLSYDILSWKMIDTDEWQTDQGLNVWLGD